MFSDYISGVLPELGEEPVRQWSLHDLAALLLEGITKVALPVSAADEADPVRRPVLPPRAPRRSLPR